MIMVDAKQSTIHIASAALQLSNEISEGKSSAMASERYLIVAQPRIAHLNHTA